VTVVTGNVVKPRYPAVTALLYLIVFSFNLLLLLADLIAFGYWRNNIVCLSACLWHCALLPNDTPNSDSV